MTILNKIVKVTNSSLEGVSDGGWHVDLWDLDSVEAPPLLEDAVVLDANLTASIPLAALGSPTDVRFQGLMIASDYPDPDDPLTVVEWSDRAPDADDEWRGVGSVEG